MVCTLPCLTCPASTNKFYLCSSCSASQMFLKGSLCIKQPIFLIQIVCTFLLILFIILPLMRKRCVTFIRIFDCIQIVAYFKYINGYINNRQNYLYLNMRAWGQWAQGWKLLAFADDIIIPIWTNQQTMLNKIVRIFAIWLAVIVIMLLFGIVKTMTGDSQITLTKYLQKNLIMSIVIGFYINVQDMSFVMANSFHSFISSNTLSGTYRMIQFAVSIVFLLMIIFMVIWIFSIINFDYMKQLDKTPQKIYPYVYMFLFALDYDIFQSYQLTTLPEKEKRIYRYSNIRVIDIIKKVCYSFLIISYLYTDEDNLTGQIVSILAFIVFFDLIWYISMPYDINKQKIQFIISIISDLLVIVLLMMPIIISNSTIQMILCLLLFVLAIVSGGIEIFMDLYCMIPVDLYQTGLSVIIQDKKLLKQIQQRKRIQQQNQRRLKQMQQNNRKLKQELQARKTRKTTQKLKQQSQDTLHEQTNKQKYNSFISENDQQKNHNQKQINNNNDNDDVQQHTSINSDRAAQLYKIDEQKRRKIYQYNKKAKFIYSNKIED